MNDDGVGIVIPHDDQPNEAPEQAPAILSIDAADPSPDDAADAAIEQVLGSSAPITGDPNSGNAPIDTATAGQDPIEEDGPSHMSNSPFSGRSHYQPASKKTKAEIPQFFNDAIAASNPVKPPRRNRNKLFISIGIGIGAVALIALIVFVIIPFISNSITNQKVTANNRQIRAVFNEYANFVLNGTESGDEIGEYDNDKIYFITERYRDNSVESLAAFYRKANEKYTKFKDKVNELYPKDDEHRTKIDEYSANFSLSYSNAIHGDYPEIDLAKSFLADGEDIAIQKAKDFYADYRTEDYSSTYIGDAINYYSSLIDILKFYVRNNCDNSSDILNGTCYARFRNDSNFKRIIDAKNSASEQKFNTMMYANTKVRTEIWSIYEQIKE